jgi:hypothetical protein
LTGAAQKRKLSRKTPISVDNSIFGSGLSIEAIKCAAHRARPRLILVAAPGQAM